MFHLILTCFYGRHERLAEFATMRLEARTFRVNRCVSAHCTDCSIGCISIVATRESRISQRLEKSNARRRGSFPIESPQCRKRSAAVHVQCSARGRAPSGRCTFMLVTSLLTFRQRHTVRTVMQRTHATQLSNFDNALLCSAFKFLLYHRSLSAFLHFSRSDHG